MTTVDLTVRSSTDVRAEIDIEFASYRTARDCRDRYDSEIAAAERNLRALRSQRNAAEQRMAAYVARVDDLLDEHRSIVLLEQAEAVLRP